MTDRDDGPRPTRVTYVTSRYRPHAGGVETHVHEVATRLAERGHDVTVVSADRGTTVDGRRLPARETLDGVAVRRVRALAPGGAIHVAPGVVSAVRGTDPDLVHAHNYHSTPLVFAALAVGPGTPLVATPHYHGGSASGLRDRLLTPYRYPGGWALNRADAVVAVSRWEARQLATDFGVSAEHVPNGLDVNRFREAEPAPSPRGRPYLLCVGRLERYKGVQHVVRSLPDLPGYDLVVAGSGPARPLFEDVAREVGVTERVDFRGFVPNERLPPLYAGAAAYVTMSAFEAYGITVAEALAAGTPAVVRRAGALVDWADRADCVGVDLGGVAAGVRAAVGREAPSEPLATWDDVADRVARLYGELGSPA